MWLVPGKLQLKAVARDNGRMTRERLTTQLTATAQISLKHHMDTVASPIKTQFSMTRYQTESNKNKCKMYTWLWTHKKTPQYFALMGELWRVYCLAFKRKLEGPTCINGQT